MRRGNTDYTLLRDMDQATGTWKKFFVIVSGRTNGAHHDIVAELKGVGHSEVSSRGESDYLLVFCSVSSRVGTNVREALDKMDEDPGDQPAILVVMHHTYDADYIVVDSRRLVDNPNVRLTVDCLFHDGRFLNCRRNTKAVLDIQRFLKISRGPKKPRNSSDCKWLGNNWYMATFVFFFTLVIFVGAVFVIRSLILKFGD